MRLQSRLGRHARPLGGGQGVRRRAETRFLVRQDVEETEHGEGTEHDDDEQGDAGDHHRPQDDVGFLVRVRGMRFVRAAHAEASNGRAGSCSGSTGRACSCQRKAASQTPPTPRTAAMSIQCSTNFPGEKAGAIIQ